jgi:hypothetical protein
MSESRTHACRSPQSFDADEHAAFHAVDQLFESKAGEPQGRARDVLLRLYLHHATQQLTTAPGVAAGIASEPWSVANLIERTMVYNPLKPTVFGRFIDSLPDGQ